jgi:ADP-ribose pyrophosphatase YjhB (NUDIX family)
MEMLDGHTIDRYVAGGVVVNPDGKIAVVSQQGRTWSLPKGGIEAGETEEQAARREIAEETGLTELTLVSMLGVYGRFRMGIDGKDMKNSFRKIVMFLYTTSQTNLQPRDPENPEALWLAQDAVEEKLTHYKDKEFFRTIKDTLHKRYA